MTRNLKLIMLFIFLQAAPFCFGQSGLQSHKEVLLLMGTRFELTAIADTKAQALQAVELGIKEIERIENLISSWKKDSQTTAINKHAGISPVIVDQELFDLIYRSQKINKITKGAFDISFASIERLYTFDKKERLLPSAEKRKESIKKINANDIILDEKHKSVFLKEEGMKIGFGGIGKGYAANKAKALMEKLEGIKGGVVNASGDLVTWGINENPKGWSVQISDPKDINKTLGWLYINDMSIVTSGDYEKYFTSNGKRYAHIIDPFTGLPTTGIKSVTVISKDAEINDALATSMFIMGANEAIEFINQMKDIEALIVTDDDILLHSKNLILNTY